MKELELIGVIDESGDLLHVSECNSQVEGSEFDGPVLFRSLWQAREVLDESGGLPEGNKYCVVKISIEVPQLTQKAVLEWARQKADSERQSTSGCRRSQYQKSCRILRDVIMRHHKLNWGNQSKTDLVELMLEWVMDSAPRTLMSMTEEELAEQIATEVAEGWDLTTLDEFLKHPIVTGE